MRPGCKGGVPATPRMGTKGGRLPKMFLRRPLPLRTLETSASRRVVIDHDPPVDRGAVGVAWASLPRRRPRPDPMAPSSRLAMYLVSTVPVVPEPPKPASHKGSQGRLRVAPNPCVPPMAVSPLSAAQRPFAVGLAPHRRGVIGYDPPMTPSSRLALYLVAMVLVVSAEANAAWRHVAGDPQATARTSEGVGDFGGDPADRPGVTWTLGLPSTGLGATAGADADGRPDLIATSRAGSG